MPVTRSYTTTGLVIATPLRYLALDQLPSHQVSYPDHVLLLEFPSCCLCNVVPLVPDTPSSMLKGLTCENTAVRAIELLRSFL